MSIANKILNKIGIYSKKDLKRAYNSAQVSRLRSSWELTASSIDRDVKAGLEPTRNRARNMYRNNAYAKGAVLRARTNIAGPKGFYFQNRAKKENELNEFDEVANSAVETAFNEYCEPQNCTLAKEFPLLIVKHLIVQQLFRDGEFLARMITGPSAQNKFGFTLELLETDALDTRLDQELSNGNVIKMGREFNTDRQCVAYWFKKITIKDELSYSDYRYSEHYRVSADEILFGFDPEHPKQTRAVSPFVQSMTSLYMVDDWEESSLINADWSAKLLGFYVKKRIEGDTFGGQDEKGKEPFLKHDLDAAYIEELPFGYEYQDFKRQFPSEQHSGFLKSMLRKIATGLGISYNSLSNDLEGVNLSSLRHGLNEERDLWLMYQEFTIELFLKKLYKKWLWFALLSNSIYGYTILDYDRLCAPEFTGRRWKYLEPYKEAVANRINEEQGYESRAGIIREKGGNKELIDEEIKKDLEIKQKLLLGKFADIDAKLLEDEK